MAQPKSIKFDLKSSISTDTTSSAIHSIEEQQFHSNHQFFWKGGLSNMWRRIRHGGVTTTSGKHLRFEGNQLKIKHKDGNDQVLEAFDTFVSEPRAVSGQDTSILNNKLLNCKNVYQDDINLVCQFELYNIELDGNITLEKEYSTSIEYVLQEGETAKLIAVQLTDSMAILECGLNDHIKRWVINDLVMTEISGTYERFYTAYLVSSNKYPDNTTNTQPTKQYIVVNSLNQRDLYVLSKTGQLIQKYSDEAFSSISIGGFALRDWEPASTAGNNNEVGVVITGCDNKIVFDTITHKPISIDDTHKLGAVLLSSTYDYFADTSLLTTTRLKQSQSFQGGWNCIKDDGDIHQTDTHPTTIAYEPAGSQALNIDNTLTLNTADKIYYPTIVTGDQNSQVASMIRIDAQCIEDIVTVPIGNFNQTTPTGKYIITQKAQSTKGLYFIGTRTGSSSQDFINMIDGDGALHAIGIGSAFNPFGVTLIANGDYVYLFSGGTIWYIDGTTVSSLVYDGAGGGLIGYKHIGGLTILAFSDNSNWLLTGVAIKRLRYKVELPAEANTGVGNFMNTIDASNIYLVNIAQAGDKILLILYGKGPDYTVGGSSGMGGSGGTTVSGKWGFFGRVVTAADFTPTNLMIKQIKEQTTTPIVNIQNSFSYSNDPHFIISTVATSGGGTSYIFKADLTLAVGDIDISKSIPGYAEQTGIMSIVDEHDNILIRTLGTVSKLYTGKVVYNIEFKPDPDAAGVPIDPNYVVGQDDYYQTSWEITPNTIPMPLCLPADIARSYKKILDRYFFIGGSLNAGATAITTYCCEAVYNYIIPTSTTRVSTWTKEEALYYACNKQIWKLEGDTFQLLGVPHTHDNVNTYIYANDDPVLSSGAAALLARETRVGEVRSSVVYIEGVSDFQTINFNSEEGLAKVNNMDGSVENFENSSIMLGDSFDTFWDKLNYKSFRAIHAGRSFQACSYKGYLVSPVGIGDRYDISVWTDPAPYEEQNHIYVVHEGNNHYIIVVGKHIERKIQEVSDYVYQINSPHTHNLIVDINDTTEELYTTGVDWNNRITWSECLDCTALNEHDSDSMVVLATSYNANYELSNNRSVSTLQASIFLSCTRNQSGFPLLSATKMISNNFIVDLDVYSTQTGLYSTSLIGTYGLPINRIRYFEDAKLLGVNYPEPGVGGILMPFPINTYFMQTESNTSFMRWGQALSAIGITNDNKTMAAYFLKSIIYGGNYIGELNGNTYMYDNQSIYLLDIQQKTIQEQVFIVNLEGCLPLGSDTDGIYFYDNEFGDVKVFNGARKVKTIYDLSALDTVIASIYNQKTETLGMATKNSCIYWRNETVIELPLPAPVIRVDSNNEGPIYYLEDGSHVHDSVRQLSDEYFMLPFHAVTEWQGSDTNADLFDFGRFFLRFYDKDMKKASIQIRLETMNGNTVTAKTGTYKLDKWNNDGIINIPIGAAENVVGQAFRLSIDSKDKIFLSSLETEISPNESKVDGLITQEDTIIDGAINSTNSLVYLEV